jgi:hypothetical protein
LSVVVHGLLAVLVVVARAAGAAAQHPGVVAERREVFARAPAGVHVAPREVGEEEEEEDSDDSVADGGAGLEGRDRLAMVCGEEKGCLAPGCTYVAPPP